MRQKSKQVQESREKFRRILNASDEKVNTDSVAQPDAAEELGNFYMSVLYMIKDKGLRVLCEEVRKLMFTDDSKDLPSLLEVSMGIEQSTYNFLIDQLYTNYIAAKINSVLRENSSVEVKKEKIKKYFYIIPAWYLLTSELCYSSRGGGPMEENEKNTAIEGVSKFLAGTIEQLRKAVANENIDELWYPTVNEIVQSSKEIYSGLKKEQLSEDYQQIRELAIMSAQYYQLIVSTMSNPDVWVSKDNNQTIFKIFFRYICLFYITSFCLNVLQSFSTYFEKYKDQSKVKEALDSKEGAREFLAYSVYRSLNIEVFSSVCFWDEAIDNDSVSITEYALPYIGKLVHYTMLFTHDFTKINTRPQYDAAISVSVKYVLEELTGTYNKFVDATAAMMSASVSNLNEKSDKNSSTILEQIKKLNDNLVKFTESDIQELKTKLIDIAQTQIPFQGSNVN